MVNVLIQGLLRNDSKMKLWYHGQKERPATLWPPVVRVYVCGVGGGGGVREWL